MTPQQPTAAPQVPQPGAGVSRNLAPARTIIALMLREMTSRYGKSPGGYAWAILEPLGAIIILGFGFSLMFRNPPLGSSFILFYATGYLPFSMYNNLSNMIARAINYSRPLLFYPAVTWMDAILARFLLNSLTNMLIAYILFVGLLAVTDTRAVVEIVPIVIAMGLAMLMGLGIGAMNCVLNGLFPVWDMVWSIATRPLFIVSGVLFTYESLPRTIQDILWWNPLLHISGLMRSGFYPMYQARYVSITYVLLVSLICIAMGFLLLRRHHRDILNQ